MISFNELFLTAYNFYSDGLFNLAVEKLDEAENVYSTSDNNEFSLEDLFILRGTSKFSQRLFEEARQDFEKAMQTNPNSSEACLGLGKYFMVKGLEENAKIMFEWAVKNNQTNPGALAALKEVNINLGLPEDDNTVLANYLQNEVSTENNNIEDATELFTQKRFAEAIEKLNIARKEQEAVLASIENFIAFNYLGLNDLEKASKSAEYALKLNPFSSQAYATLGEIDFLNNKLRTSRTKFNLSLSYNKENDFAKQGLQKVDRLLSNSGFDNSIDSDLEKLVAESLYK